MDDSGYTAVHWAIASGDEETINFFLKRSDGRRSELGSVSGVGLLQVAAAAGHWGAAQWLLTRGDDVNAYDASGRTPLHAAVAANKAAMAKALVARGAKLNALDTEQHSPLWLAIRTSMLVSLACCAFGPTTFCPCGYRLDSTWQLTVLGVGASVGGGAMRGAAAGVWLHTERT